MSHINSETTQERSAELSQENQARATVYNFLSSLFAKEVTSDVVTQLTSAQGQDFLNSLALEPVFSDYINDINTELAKLNSETALLELAADFCGLFLVDGRTSVSPYAGQYLNAELKNEHSQESGNKRKMERTQLFGELHQHMTAFLTYNQLQVHSKFPEPGDHIAVILAYTAHLCTTAKPEEQLNFIKHYLTSWIADFTQQINKHDHNLFYRTVAGLTQQWLQMEVEDLQRE
jgi:TorA-specific chaperone